MKILFIDDSPEMRQILERYLKTWGFDARGAADGEIGWELIQSDCPDMVITDWMMPRLDGVELCRRIRGAGLSKYVYIILLTARNVKEDLLVGMEAGADDFVSKPFDKHELKARINAAARIISLEREMEEKNRELEEKNLKLHEAYDIISEGLEAAAQIQRSLIPEKISDVAGITYDWLFCPSQFVAGDIFNITMIDEANLAFYLLDVSGHGIPAAMLSTTLSRILAPSPNFSGPIRRPRPDPPYYMITPPREVASELNERFMSDGIHRQYFTMVYGTLDIRTGEGLLTQAGHPSPIHQASDGTVRLIGEGGFPIGLVPDADYEDIEVAIKPGERLFLYSDGITECLGEGDKNNYFGIDRLMDVISKSHGSSLREVMIMIENELDLFRGELPYDDDISLFAIERTDV